MTDTRTEEQICPHCCGDGEVWFPEGPTFCYPCQGTGLKPHMFRLAGSGAPPWKSPYRPSTRRN